MLTRGRRHPFHPKPQLPSPRGELAGFKSERWPLSNQNRGRLQIGTVAGIKSEKVAAFSWNLHAFQLQCRNLSEDSCWALHIQAGSEQFEAVEHFMARHGLATADPQAAG
jgi:hypothetical protein